MEQQKSAPKTRRRGGRLQLWMTLPRAVAFFGMLAAACQAAAAWNLQREMAIFVTVLAGAAMATGFFEISGPVRRWRSTLLFVEIALLATICVQMVQRDHLQGLPGVLSETAACLYTGIGLLLALWLLRVPALQGSVLTGALVLSAVLLLAATRPPETDRGEVALNNAASIDSLKDRPASNGTASSSNPSSAPNTLASRLARIRPQTAPAPTGIREAGNAITSPLFSYYWKPFTRYRDLYPDNERGYFDVETCPDPRLFLDWHLYYGDAGWGTFTHRSEGSRVILRIDTEHVVYPSQDNPMFSCEGITAVKGRSYHFSFRGRAEKPRQVVTGLFQEKPPHGDAVDRWIFTLSEEWRLFNKTLTAKLDGPVKWTFTLSDQGLPIELSDLKLESDGETIVPRHDRQLWPYYVCYQMNAKGFRGPDVSQTPPDGVLRILVLGDSYTFGQGVHDEDLYTARLQARLNRQAETEGRKQRYEVLNFGMCGLPTREERYLYEKVASKFKPHVVLLMMYINDNQTLEESLKSSAIPTERGYEGCVAEIVELQKACRGNGAKLAVAAFRIDHNDAWKSLIPTIDNALRGLNIPFLDLGTSLLREQTTENLMVHPSDGHPNDVAHQLAARRLEGFLRQHGYLEIKSVPSASDH